MTYLPPLLIAPVRLDALTLARMVPVRGATRGGA